MTENLPDTKVGNIGYISKQAAIDLINKISNLDIKAKGGICVSLANLQKADVVQVVHARWVNYSPVTIKCSQCGHVIHDWRYSECKYCPNCGAKMDGGDEHG